jgi:predicted CXXCH cytochrome family protein
MRNLLIVLGLLIAVALAALVFRRDDDAPHSPPVRAPGGAAASTPAQPAAAAQVARRGREGFVGSAACAPCHAAESEAYLGSHHAKALVTPSPELAKARFDGGHFTSKLGGTTKFSLHEQGPVVSTPAANGNTETFPISYVSGVWPLEQYVVATERGKLQALGVVWDSRAETTAKRRWLHVYGPDGIGPSDPLFFTSAAQNWNHMCAECHSTWVERRYDAAADRFDTRWAELSVGCEACHGPGADHVQSAQAAGSGPVLPLRARLKHSAPWTPSGSGSPLPHPQDGFEVEVCAPCHSRREPLKEAFLASDAFLDSFEPELLLPGRYHADGQVEGEVYEWGSFLQSRMYQAGVRCSDCHNPHSGKLQAEGNALCVRCHEPARFDVEAHSHHGQQAPGKAPRCIDCHMPPNTFMQIDERRDHSIRIPRPDHSVAFGTPNACNGCHARESATWARDQVAKWFPAASARAHFVEGLGKDRQGALDAPKRAAQGWPRTRQSPPSRAPRRWSAWGAIPAQQALPSLRVALASPEPLVVYGAVLGAAQLPAAAARAPVARRAGALHARRARRRGEAARRRPPGTGSRRAPARRSSERSSRWNRASS